MAITQEEVLKVAHLARLQMPENSMDEYAKKLSSILDMVEQLNAVDTSGVEPMANSLDATQRLRDDVVTETNHREKYQAIAPEVDKGLYLVPKVIE
ncbi:MAG: Asp-tRNA(Asn)/Glu-tRNA(Gln) amidotransferase GatCAB subunit C [Proteobacteria bacterium]|nr:MAG: Asp-tRNA(Asn)/Glu-tRNA(Gln) amidotransferase GatCAB subunit C [Pseudomonadota bacterium]